MNTAFADDTSDDSSDQLVNDAPCDDPLYDGSGYDNGVHGEGQSGNQRGDMDGSKTQLKDGSGDGGMYGEYAGTGDCLNA